MDKFEKEINKILPLSTTHLVYKNKIILSEKILKNLKISIKNNIKNPSKNLDVFIIKAVFDSEDDEYPLAIIVELNHLTPELELKPVLGYWKNFIYTPDDLLKYGFKKNHLDKMMNAVKNRTVSFRKIDSSIVEIFEKKK
jgi:hypothetical protein